MAAMPEFEDQVIAKVNKLIMVGFIKEIQYPWWLSSIVPVEKKNVKVRVYIDFRDLNRARPKDDFLLPITEMVVDATTGFEALPSWMGHQATTRSRWARRMLSTLLSGHPRATSTTP
jgi:hypothetical protein